MKQLEMFDEPESRVKQRCRPGWFRRRGGVAAEYLHVATGWTIHRCGHPTALWPYYGLPPGIGTSGCSRSEMLLTGGFGIGLAFQTVALAMAAVEDQIAATGFDAPIGAKE